MQPKKHIYFVPGLAAGPEIFENLKLSEDKFKLHFLEWLVPISEKEKLEDYAKRMTDLILEQNPILVGVSFGGIMVQEMAKHISTEKVIIISSVKSRNELPKRLKLIQKTGVYKLFPASAIKNIENFSAYAFGDFIKKRIALYKQYLSVRDERYLHWAIYNVLHWKQLEPPKNLVHIHGADDRIFPIKHINNCTKIENANHIMILTKAKTISKILEDIV